MAVDTLAASLAAYAVAQDATRLVCPIWRDEDVPDTWFPLWGDP